MNIAIAIFAKTIGLSPVKTRLAAEIGRKQAEVFYDLSVKATAELVATACQQARHSLTPYWALAEEEALVLSQWQSFNHIWTGEGGLGQRLHHIYSSLLKKHDGVMLIGTDSPHLAPETIMEAANKLQQAKNQAVIGAADDGGFYLFAAKEKIAESAWLNVSYSQNDTLAQLEAELIKINISAQHVERNHDVDTLDDLKTLNDYFNTQTSLLPQQIILHHWVKTII